MCLTVIKSQFLAEFAPFQRVHNRCSDSINDVIVEFLLEVAGSIVSQANLGGLTVAHSLLTVAFQDYSDQRPLLKALFKI